MTEKQIKKNWGPMLFVITLGAVLFFFWWLLIFTHGVAPVVE